MLCRVYAKCQLLQKRLHVAVVLSLFRTSLLQSALHPLALRCQSHQSEWDQLQDFVAKYADSAKQSMESMEHARKLDNPAFVL